MSGSLVAVGLLGSVVGVIPTPGFQPEFAHAAVATTRVSTTSSGAQASGSQPAISADGAYVVFVSNSTALSTNPNGYNEVYRKNISTGAVDLVSVNTSAAVSTGNSANPVISANGQFVAFDSDAADIVSSDTNGVRDVFVRDMSAQTTTAVSVTPAGVLGNGVSAGPSMSSDAQKIAFTSAAPNLGYPAYQFHDNAVILRDRAHNTTSFASPMPHGWASSQAGDPGGGQNYFMQVKTGPQAISADGRYIVFDGKSAWRSGDAYCNGGASDENVYAFDTAAGVSTFLSWSNNAPLNNTCADHPAISSDGSTVVFRVAAPVYWLTSPSGAIIQTLNPALSGNANGGDCGGGVFGYNSCGIADPVLNSYGYRIAFSGTATNLVASDTNNAEDVFYLDRAGGGSQRVSLSTSGTQGNGASTAPSIRGDATTVAFGSTATNLVSGDTNAASDAFGRSGLQAPAVPSSNLGTGDTGLGGGFNDAEWALSCGAPRRNFVVPVEALSGNFWHTFDDISVPGRGLALHFTHTYNAASAAANGPLGYGWTEPYNMSLTLGTGNPPSTATVNQENGAQAPFSLVGSAYSAPSRVTATLVHNGDGTWTFTRHGTQIFTFNSSRQLTSERDLNGYTTTIGPVGATQTITDPAGRTFTLTYTSGRITQLTDTASPPRSVAFAYNDGAGNLTDVTDVGGGNWHFTYDASHRMLTMRDPRGYTTTNHYDASGRADWQQDQLNRQTSFDYTSIPGSTKITDPKGNVVVQAYANGLLTSETDGYGTAQAATTTYMYDPATLGCSAVTDPNLHVTSYTYDAQGNQLTKLDPLGHLTIDAYDGLNDLVTETDPNQVTTALAFDASGNLLSRSTPLSGICPGAQCQVTTYGYLGGGDTHAGDVTSMTDPNGKVTSYGYDANGDRTSVTDPVGNKTTLGFDTVGHLTSKVTPKGNVTGCGCAAQYTTSYSLNAFGDVLTTTDPLAHVDTRTYDANRNLVADTDPDGNLTSYLYDQTNKVLTETRADASQISYTYDFADNKSSATQAGPPAAKDGFNRPNGALGSALTGQAWASDTGSPTVASNQWAPSAANSRSVVNAGLANGVVRSTVTMSPTAGSSNPYLILHQVSTGTFLYVNMDEGADTVALWKAANNTTFTNLSGNTPYTFAPGGTYAVSALINNSQITVAINGKPVVYWTLQSGDQATYGAATSHGVAANVPNANYAGIRWDDFSVALTATTNYTYDSLNRPSTSVDQLGRTTTYGYDPASNRTSLKDASNRTTTDGYDSANELKTITYSDGVTPNVTNIGYDADGQRTSMTDGTGTSNFSYDALHRMTQSTNGASSQVGYGYDLKGQLTSITYPGNHVVNRTYYDNGTLHTVADWLSHTTTMSYDPNSNLQTQAYPNTTTATPTFDAADRLMGVAHAKSGTNFANFTYGRDANNQLTSATMLNGGQNTSESYGYSRLNQLTGSTYPYGYDGADNLTNLPTGAALTYDTANQATKESQAGGGTTFADDPQGNRTSATPSVGQTTAYTYDQANRLTAATPGTFRGQVAGGESHSLVIKGDGTVWAAGYGYEGELGNNYSGDAALPVKVAGLSGMVAVSAGSYFSLGLKGDGTVWAWGSNLNGQLGNNSTTNSLVPVQVSGLTGVVGIAAGDSFALAVKADGTVWAWGYNGSGELGDGTTTQRLVPVQVSGLSGVTAVTAGYGHSVALKADGTVWTWGFNGNGELGNNSTVDSHVPVSTGLSGVSAVSANSGGSHTLAAKADGTAWAWGSNYNGQVGNNSTTDVLVPVQVSGLSGVSVVAAGGDHSLAAKSDGSVWAWGANYDGQLGNNSTTDAHVPLSVSSLSGVTGLGAGTAHSLTVKSDGSVLAWGANYDGGLANGTFTESDAPFRTTGLGADPTSSQGLVAGGSAHTLAVTAGGAVSAWGGNYDGQLGIGSTTDVHAPTPVGGMTGVSGVAAGSAHSLAVRSDGTAWAWGYNHDGELGNNSTTDAHAPVAVSGLGNVLSVSAGNLHSLALKADGSVWAWGYNASGQLGNNSTTSSVVPVQVTGMPLAYAVAGGGGHSLALGADGTVWAWGSNSNGQLGNNSTTDSHVPIQVAGLSGVVAVSAGGAHSVALKSDGTVWEWGANANGQLGNNSITDSHVPVQVSSLAGAVAIGATPDANHTLAIKTDGTAWAWGQNSRGQLGNNSTTDSHVPVQVSALSGVTGISASALAHSVALKSDGSVWDWGANSTGQLGNNSTTDSHVPVQANGFARGITPRQGTYAYNGDGLRMSKTTAAGAEAFTWDLSRGLPALLVDGGTNFLYDDAGLPIEQVDTAGTALYYHHDQLGSTRSITDGTGNVVGTLNYDPYGNTTLSSGTTTPLGYAGQYTDAESGLLYMRARYYDPATGQFLTRDPIVAVTGEAYSYADENPLNGSDPSGQLCQHLSGLGVGFCNPEKYKEHKLAKAANDLVKAVAESPQDVAEKAYSAAGYVDTAVSCLQHHGQRDQCAQKLIDSLFSLANTLGPGNDVLFSKIEGLLEYVSRSFDTVSHVLQSGELASATECPGHSAGRWTRPATISA